MARRQQSLSRRRGRSCRGCRDRPETRRRLSWVLRGAAASRRPMRYNASRVTGADGYKHSWTGAAAVRAAILSAQISAGQPPHGPGIDWNYGSIAEGYTSAFAGGSVEAAYRMFSAPDFDEVCAQAGADAVKSLRAVRHVAGRGGETLPYHA